MEKSRKEWLKDYLKRLGEGEALETVRTEFVARFREVDAAEIMQAEQEMLQEGVPLTEVQRLCDVHAVLFHGTITEERIDGTEGTDPAHEIDYAGIRKERAHKTRILTEEPGHPLYTFTKENEALAALLERAKKAAEEGQVSVQLLNEVRGLAIHYAKKGDLLYPHLKVHYQISGPSDVMWTVDDEIRDELAALAKLEVHDKEWLERFKTAIDRAEEMIYKEKNILFPNCAANFTEEEWIGIYYDAKDYADCLGVTPENWNRALNGRKEVQSTVSGDEIRMPGGSLTLTQLTALLNTIPMEITFVDTENINRYFNEGPKDFKRPGMAIGREVFSCHPPKAEARVRRILQELRAGTLDEVPVWMDKNGKCMLVRYMAVRDSRGEYLGTVELVQDMGFAKEHFKEK